MPIMPDREPIHVAVIGAGAIARGAHLPALRAVGKRVEVVALVDLNPELLAATADEWGIPGRYDEVPAMLVAEKPDLVVVCTPPGVHKHAAIAALDAGAWVWCEKPPMLSLGELEAQRDALQARLREAREVLEARGAEVERNRILLERMLLEPKRYKFARLHRADVDMGGCGAWQVRPRLGLIGMMMGWWPVKLSSGSPLAT